MYRTNEIPLCKQVNPFQNMLIPITFPLIPKKRTDSKNRRRSHDESGDEELDEATLAERESIYQSINEEQQSSPLGNLSLTFPNYTNSFDNQYRKVDPS